MVHQIIRISFLLLILSFSVSSCYYSNEEDVYGGSVTCDITKAKYSERVKEIIQSNCTSCHGAGLQEAGFRIDNYDGLKGMAESGLLLKVIKHESGVVPMPYAQLKMSDCNIAIIEEWVKNGALND